MEGQGGLAGATFLGYECNCVHCVRDTVSLSGVQASGKGADATTDPRCDAASLPQWRVTNVAERRWPVTSTAYARGSSFCGKDLNG